MSETSTQRDLSPNVQTEDDTVYAGIDELWAIEGNLPKYNADVISKLSRYTDATSHVLEFGAGIGTLAGLWHARKKVKPECLEIDVSLRKILTERNFVCHKNMESINKTFDVIYSSNVLEHIDDDVAALKQIHAKLNANGIVAIYVPAFMCLYSEFDSAIGHYRRYEKSELVNKLHLAGFAIMECYFVDSIGFFAWLFAKIRGSKIDNKSGGGKSLRIYDRYIYPLSKLLDMLGCKYLFGKNILIIARSSEPAIQ